MYDNMQKRLINMKSIQYGGQMQMFSTDDAGDIIDADKVAHDLERHIGTYSDFTALEDVLACFVASEGLTLPLKELRAHARRLEESGAIEVNRKPPVTEQGKASSFMESKGDRRIEVRARNGNMR